MSHTRAGALLLAAGALVAFLAPTAEAQTWTPEQSEVWAFIEADWDAGMQKDLTRFEQNVHPSFQGWDNGNPAPRDRDSTLRWNRFGDETSTTLMQQLHPLAIIVEGNTAVAHYLYSEASEDSEGKRETTHGRYTDVLIRDGSGWKFIAWAGGEDSDDGN